MRKMSKCFAIVFLVIAFVAFYGVFASDATWHIATGFFSLFIAMLFASDKDKKQSLQAK
jgi:preprotein translocase subunit SecG